MTRFIVILVSALMAVPAFAKSITHPTCYVYLPVNDKVSSWATLRQVFLDKGYTPIETEEPASNFKVDSLIAGINYNFSAESSSHKYGIQKAHCTVTFKIERLIQADPLQLGLVFTKKESNTTWRFGEDLPTIKCLDKDVLKAMPKCTVSK